MKLFLVKILNQLYLYYLGLIPIFATFLIIQKINWSDGAMMVLFLFGTAIIGVYLAMIISYTKQNQNLFFLLLIFLDGPIFGYLASQNLYDVSGAIINTFLIENLAIWFSIPLVARTQERASKEQIFFATVLASILLGGLIFLLIQIDFFSKSLREMTLILFGIIEALILKFRILYKDEIAIGYGEGGGFILIFITLWVAVFFISIAFTQA